MTTPKQTRKIAADGPTPPAQSKSPEGGDGGEASRLCLIGLKVDSALRSEIDAYAEAHGITRSRAANPTSRSAGRPFASAKASPVAGPTSSWKPSTACERRSTSSARPRSECCASWPTGRTTAGE
jgi:hypothetical protein